MRKRLTQVMECMNAQPAASFPVMMGTVAAREGFYRMIQNDDINFPKLLEPHVQDVIDRASGHKRVLVLHDTTECRFGGEQMRDGLGRINKNDQGFLAHCSMVVTDDSEHLPLGMVMVQPIVRTGQPVRGTLREQYNRDDKESGRWLHGVMAAEALLGANTAWHVMDREADDFVLQAELVEKGIAFVIRTKGSRVLGPAEKRGNQAHNVQEYFAATAGMFQREVPISARGHKRSPTRKKKHPPRQQRAALLHFTAGTLQINRPSYVDKRHPRALAVNIVHVKEDASTIPEGGEGVEWFLTTSQPIATQAQIEAVVDAYRARWTIEEFFKALKTGCAFETRRLESLDSLLIVLAMFIPIATNLLVLRSLSRTRPAAPASEILSETTLRVLRATSPLKKDPLASVTHALLHIAALGGHIKNNGAPGWLVITRGYERLVLLQAGWAAAQKTDQS
jgi:Transposase DDE domain